MFGYLGRVLTSWWHEGFHHSPQTPGDKPRSPCGRWLCAPRTLSSWHLLSPPQCTWDRQNHPVISRLQWKQNTDIAGTGPAIGLAVGQIYLHWFPFSAATLKIQLTPLPPTDGMCTAIFKKIPYCSCENWFTIGKAMGNGKMIQKIKSDFLDGDFFLEGRAQTERSCFGIHAKIQNINEEGTKKGRTHRRDWNLTF